MDTYTDILLERKDRVAILSFNRPSRLNALSDEMMIGSARLIASLAEEGRVRALIITGSGRGFCSGADLGVDRPFEENIGVLGAKMRRTINPLILAIVHAPFPVIAAVNGPAVGAGAGLALSCDFLIGARSMQLLLTFSKLGVGLDAGTSLFLNHMIGAKRASAVAMLGDPIDASRALEWGLAYSVVDDNLLQQKSLEVAERLASLAPLGLAAQKRQLYFAQSPALEAVLEMEADVQDELIKTRDVQESLAAFREKRAAEYLGR